MFTKGLPLGKRPIYCRHLQITYVYFLPDSEKISQTTIGAWTDTSRVYLDDIKVFEPSEEGDSIDCASDSPMLQMIRKTKLHIDFRFIWTLQDRNHNTTRCLSKNE